MSTQVQGYRLSPQQRRVWQLQADSRAYRSQGVVALDGALDAEALRRALAERRRAPRGPAHDLPPVAGHPLPGPGRRRRSPAALAGGRPRGPRARGAAGRGRRAAAPVRPPALRLRARPARRRDARGARPRAAPAAPRPAGARARTERAWATSRRGSPTPTLPARRPPRSPCSTSSSPSGRTSCSRARRASPGGISGRGRTSRPRSSSSFPWRGAEARVASPRSPWSGARRRGRRRRTAGVGARRLGRRRAARRLAGPALAALRARRRRCGRALRVDASTRISRARWGSSPASCRCPSSSLPDSRSRRSSRRPRRPSPRRADYQDFYVPEEGEKGRAGVPACFQLEEWGGAREARGLSFSLLRRYARTSSASRSASPRCGATGRSPSSCATTRSACGAEAAKQLAERFLAARRGDARAPRGGDRSGGDPDRRRAQAAARRMERHRRGAPADLGRPALRALAALSPEEIAVELGERRLTYAELNSRANRLARHLRGQGVGPGALVGLCLERSPEMLVALLGVLKAGAAYLPARPVVPGRAPGLHARGRRRAHAAHPERAVWSVCRRLGGASLFCLDSRLGARRRESGRGPADVGARPTTSPTSSTPRARPGRPKGVMVPHRGLATISRWARARLPASAEGHGAPVHSPLGFDLTVTSLFAPLLAGRAVTLLAGGARASRRSPRRCAAPAGFSLVKLTPAHLATPRPGAGAAASRAGRTRALVIGGEALSARRSRRWRGARPGDAADQRVRADRDGRRLLRLRGAAPATLPRGPVPIGRPIANTRALRARRQRCSRCRRACRASCTSAARAWRAAT